MVRRWIQHAPRGAAARPRTRPTPTAIPSADQWRGLASVELRRRSHGSWLGESRPSSTPGRCGQTTDAIGADDLVVAVGGGGPLIRTPIGPIHLDFAWNVGDPARPTDRTGSSTSESVMPTDGLRDRRWRRVATSSSGRSLGGRRHSRGLWCCSSSLDRVWPSRRPRTADSVARSSSASVATLPGRLRRSTRRWSGAWVASS